MPVIPVLRRLRQGGFEFNTNLGYTVRPCLKNKTERWTWWHTPAIPGTLEIDAGGF
jgi:hypothetical protein